MQIVQSKITLRRLGLALAAMLLCNASYAQIDDLRLPISLDADSTDYDGKSSMLMFRGLRLTQGSIGIEADEGRASNLDFEDSVWQFSGNVIIDVENGHIECDTADLQFANHQLTVATIGGAPATFELKRVGSEETTYAEAGKLRYDLTSGVIEFSEDATITEGGNQISSTVLVYNILEQRINADSSGEEDDRVRITYTPPDGLELPADELDTDDPPETEPEETDDGNP